MALALIPLENVQEAMDVIISEIDSNSKIATKQADFVVYFVNQWLNAKKSKQGPEIWNQHQSTIKTNNVSETNHSSMPSTIPRHSPQVCQIIKYFKECDSVSSDKFLKLKNNFSWSQMRSSKSQKDFDYFLALTHEEFSIELSSTSTEMQSDCFKAYYDKVCNQIVGRYAAYHETDSESKSDSDSDEFVRRNKKDSNF